MSEAISGDRLKEIAERAAKAARGPWVVDGTKALGAYGVWTEYGTHPGDVPGELYPDQICSVFRGNVSDFPKDVRDANAAFIAHSITDIPDLLAALSRRDARIAELEAEKDQLRTALADTLATCSFRPRSARGLLTDEEIKAASDRIFIGYQPSAESHLHRTEGA